MADLSSIQATEATRIVGSDSTGAEQTPVGSSSHGDLNIRNVINTSMLHGALSVSTTAVQAKVGASALVSRKSILITPTNGTIYWGSSALVTIASGTPIFKNQSYAIAATDIVPIYLIASSTVDVRIVEGS